MIIIVFIFGVLLAK